MGTAKSGYIQRRIIKVCEDIQVQYDGSVRDMTGKIYQMSYGDTGLNPCMTVKVGGKQEACDISRMVDRLNLQYEIKNEENEIKKSELTSKIYDITGRKNIYKEWDVEELEQRLESLNFEN